MGIKEFTKEDYIIYYRTDREKKLKENNTIEEFKFQNELTKNYAFYLSDCFGGDIKYNVLLDEKIIIVKDKSEYNWYEKIIDDYLGHTCFKRNRFKNNRRKR